MSLTTRTCLGLPVFPQDIQHQIFLFILERRDLMKTRTLVCKEWERLLTPNLFKILNIGSSGCFHGQLSPTDISARLAKASQRVTKSFTSICIRRGSPFHLHLLVSILASLPNVHTLDLFGTSLVVSLNDPAVSLPCKFSLRSLAICEGNMLTRDYDLLLALLACFDRVDKLRLEASMMNPSWESPGPWPSLPKVKNLSLGRMSCPANPHFLLRMVQQPSFSHHLVNLFVDRGVHKWDSLAYVADALRSVKDTIQTFQFFPMFGFGVTRDAVHGAAMEQTLADELSSCTALREDRLFMGTSPSSGVTFKCLSETFDLHCLLIKRVAQKGLSVTVDFKIFLDHNNDPRGFRIAMEQCNWASLDHAASNLVRRPNGQPPLTLRLTRWDRQEEGEHSRRIMESCVASMDWKHLLPRLTDPKDPKVDLSGVQWGPAHWESLEF